MQEVLKINNKGETIPTQALDIGGDKVVISKKTCRLYVLQEQICLAQLKSLENFKSKIKALKSLSLIRYIGVNSKPRLTLALESVVQVALKKAIQVSSLFKNIVVLQQLLTIPQAAIKAGRACIPPYEFFNARNRAVQRSVTAYLPWFLCKALNRERKTLYPRPSVFQPKDYDFKRYGFKPLTDSKAAKRALDLVCLLSTIKGFPLKIIKMTKKLTISSSKMCQI